MILKKQQKKKKLNASIWKQNLLLQKQIMLLPLASIKGLVNSKNNKKSEKVEKKTTNEYKNGNTLYSYCIFSIQYLVYAKPKHC